MHCMREDKTRREGNGKCDEGGWKGIIRQMGPERKKEL